MRLISTRTIDGETLGVVVGEGWRPAAELLPDGPRTIAQLLAAGPDVTNRLARIHDIATISTNSRQALPKKSAIAMRMHTSDNETLLPHKLQRLRDTDSSLVREEPPEASSRLPEFFPD